MHTPRAEKGERPVFPPPGSLPAEYPKRKQGCSEARGIGNYLGTRDPIWAQHDSTRYLRRAGPVGRPLPGPAGDMLYLPAMWFHEVHQREDRPGGRCIAVNFWHEMRFDFRWAQLQFVLRVAEEAGLCDRPPDASTGPGTGGPDRDPPDQDDENASS